MMNDFICDFRRDGFVSEMDATDATTIAVFGMGKIWENDVSSRARFPKVHHCY